MYAEARTRRDIKLRYLTSILGSLQWATVSVRFAQTHFRNLQRFYINESRTKGLENSVYLPDWVTNDIDWLISCAASSRQNGLPRCESRSSSATIPLLQERFSESGQPTSICLLRLGTRSCQATHPGLPSRVRLPQTHSYCVV